MSSNHTGPAAAARRLAQRALLTSVLVGGYAIVAASPSTAAAREFEYVVNGEVHETHQATGVDGEVGLCSTPETAEYDGRFSVRLRSTLAGLSDDDVLTLMDGEPDGTVLRASYRETGLLVQRSGPHTYTMLYQNRRTGIVQGERITLHTSFTARGTSERRTPYSISATGTIVLDNGEPVVDHDQLRVRGCLR